MAVETERAVKMSVANLTRTQLVEIEACARCGYCAGVCPVYDEVKKESITARGRIKDLKSFVKASYGPLALLLGPRRIGDASLKKFADDVYQCTLCGRCMVVCPISIRTPQLWREARASVIETGYAPLILTQVRDISIEHKNPYAMPQTSRIEWINFMDARGLAPIKDKADTVYFVGCSAENFGRLLEIPYSAALILTKAKENWTLLGEKEWCCGVPLQLVGDQKKMEEFIKHNLEAIEHTGAKKVVFTCPACYRLFKYEYPEILGKPLEFEALHMVELIDKLIEERRINLPRKVKERISYHDPCELGRLSGVFNAPRNVLSKFATDYVELPDNAMNSRCCGGGGLLTAVNPDVRLKIGVKRVKQALDSKVKILTSACPSCKLTLSDAASSIEEDIQVLDLVELVARNLE